MEVAVIVPVLEANSDLVKFMDVLKEQGFEYRIVVDDGCMQAYKPYLDEMEKNGCIVCHHSTILGKGACIRDGIREIQARKIKAAGFITIDPDGIYTEEDVCRMKMAMEQHPESVILGLRQEAMEQWQRKGRERETGVYTGLRAYPVHMAQQLLAADPKPRWTYETKVLEQALEQGIEIQGILIKSGSQPKRQKGKRFPIHGKGWFFMLIPAIINLVLYLIILYILLRTGN